MTDRPPQGNILVLKPGWGSAIFDNIDTTFLENPARGGFQPADWSPTVLHCRLHTGGRFPWAPMTGTSKSALTRQTYVRQTY